MHRVNLVRGVISQTPAVSLDAQHVLRAPLLILMIMNAATVLLVTIARVALNV